MRLIATSQLAVICRPGDLVYLDQQIHESDSFKVEKPAKDLRHCVIVSDSQGKLHQVPGDQNVYVSTSLFNRR